MESVKLAACLLVLGRLRGVLSVLLTPVARVLLQVGVSPDAVTILGAAGVVAAALTAIPAGELFVGCLAVGACGLLDLLDGVLARLAGRATAWGAFLDATLDRIADGAVFVGISLYFVLHPEVPHAGWGVFAGLACLALGGVVPYARARAEASGAKAANGVAGRPDRLVLGLAPLGLTEFGVPMVVAVAALTVVAVLSAITIVQRIVVVHRQLV